MSLLAVRQLNVDIYGASILRDVSFAIDTGNIVGLVGESGSGKSMSAYSLLRLLPKGAAVSGEVNFLGTNLLRMSEAQMCRLRGREIAMVFQEPMSALNPLKTIGWQVAETILIHEKVSRQVALARAGRILERVELPASRFFLARYPHELSGGQRQRVVLAIAIALGPKLLIADEPTAALDVTTQSGILTLLRRLVREDRMGLLLISHDLAVVADLVDDLVIMQQGQVVERGSRGELLREMKHPYTRALFTASAYVPARPARMENAALLQVEGLCCTYASARADRAAPGPLMAVKNVSFTVHRGENLGLVGESGCGKSTLARTILGLGGLQQGRILLDGEPLYQHAGVSRALRRKMQVVLQDPYGSFNPCHRVERLVSEPFHLLPHPPRGRQLQDAIAEALESVGLAAADAKKYIYQFSGGQRQRIAIARALIIKPELIILDEAVSALDVCIRAQILDLLVDLRQRFQLSYLFISHDLSVVRAISDRILVMRAGEIVDQGLTEDIFCHSPHPYTQALLAASPHLPPEYLIAARRGAGPTSGPK